MRRLLLSLSVLFALAASVVPRTAGPIFATVLAWDPNPPDENVAYYNVYGVSGGGTFLLLGSTDETTYADYEETPGDFFYVVTAVDDQNRESPPSNVVVVNVQPVNWRIK